MNKKDTQLKTYLTLKEHENTVSEHCRPKVH